MTGVSLFPNGAEFGDIVTGLPVPEGQCKAVYCSHVLEHLDRASIVRALQNTHALLQPGGVFRLVVPDLAWRSERYLKAKESGDLAAADDFLRSTYLGRENGLVGLTGRLRQAYGHAAHLWMYDELLMEKLLRDAGFVNIRRCQFGDSEEQMFARAEEMGRFFDEGHEELAMEAWRGQEI
jgi:SAM-dependent methyltransferase